MNEPVHSFRESPRRSERLETASVETARVFFSFGKSLVNRAVAARRAPSKS